VRRFVTRQGSSGTVASPDGQLKWSRPREAARLFARGVTVGTAGPVALVVGTVLSAVNQGATIIEGSSTWVTWVRVGVNYCVPFCVASIGFLAARRVPAISRAPSSEVSDETTDGPPSEP
jgi:hypothetical protein